VEELVVQLARDNRTWGYKRIEGALKNLGLTISRQSVGNILKHHGLAPAPERGKGILWKAHTADWDSGAPGQDRFRSHNLGHFLQRLAAQALANFGQGHALGVAQTEPPFDLVPENPLLAGGNVPFWTR